ncbi:MAG: glycosyltransferase family 4 protein [Actinomycetes bacterium]|jgi:glycosyltransferase involved in cell wall biosynthesis|nr:glycosyltransferase family 4 protein [Actinomycetes bacterium]
MASTLRVVIVNNFSGPRVGRYGLRALPLLRGLIARGAKVAVVAAAGSGFAHDALNAGAEVTAISMARFRAPQIMRAIKDTAWRINANVISGTGYFTNLLVRQAAPKGVVIVNTASRLPDIPMEYFGGRVEVSFRELIDKTKRHRNDAYVAISDAVADALQRQGVSAEEIFVIPNGIDADAFARAAIEYAGSGAPKFPGSDLKGRPLVFCAARTMDATKGVDVLAEAAVMLLRDWTDEQRGLSSVEGSAGGSAEGNAEGNADGGLDETPFIPAPNFRVAGSGPEKNVICDYIRGEGIGDRFDVMGFAPMIAPWYRACDIVVMPSRSEAAGVVALEAMALNKPVIASRVGGIPEVVLDGETGLLVEPDDPAALADALKQLLLNPARARALGEAGGRRVRHCFTEAQMVDAYVDLFTALTEGRA